MNYYQTAQHETSHQDRSTLQNSNSDSRQNSMHSRLNEVIKSKMSVIMRQSLTRLRHSQQK